MMICGMQPIPGKQGGEVPNTILTFLGYTWRNQYILLILFVEIRSYVQYFSYARSAIIDAPVVVNLSCL